MKRDRRKKFMNTIGRQEQQALPTVNGEHAQRTQAKLLARRGLVWCTLATRPESLYFGRNADR